MRSTGDDVAALFDGKTDLETSEVPITTGRAGSEGPSGICCLASPRYVAAEADRIGCGPLRITVPDGA